MLLLEFLLVAGAIAQASKIITEGYVFEWLRTRVARFNKHLGEGIGCQLCIGTWAGLIAALFVPEYIHISLWGDIHHITAWFADGMALGFAGRILYSVQEVVLASSYWLERSNRDSEEDDWEMPHPDYVDRRAKALGIFGTGGIDVTDEKPEASPLTLDDINRMLDRHLPERVTEPVEKEAPSYDIQDMSLEETSWTDDWDNLPDEEDELGRL